MDPTSTARLYAILNKLTGGWLAILHDTYVNFQDDECTVRAAAIAYRTLFSIFPLALLLFTLSTTLLAQPDVRGQVVQFILRNLQAPGLATDVIEQANKIVEGREAVGLLALISFLWGSSGVFSTIDEALNVAWNVQRPRPFWRSKVIGLLIAVLVSTLFLLSVAATAVVSASQFLPQVAVLIPFSELFSRAASFLVPIALSFVMFLMLYKLLPYTQVSTSSAGLGALAAAILWQISNILYTLYVARVAQGRLSQIYGSAIGVILFLLWIYLSSIILLIGAELAAAHSKHRHQPQQMALPTE